MFRIISVRRLRELENKEKMVDRVYELHRWMACFEHLDILWNYIFEGFRQISSVREDYAKAVGKSVYNEELTK